MRPRAERIAEVLDARGLDSLLVIDPDNARWLAGGPRPALFDPATTTSSAAAGTADAIALAARTAPGRIGTDAPWIASPAGVELVDLRPELEDLRRGKDAEELARLEHSAAVVDAGLLAARAAAREGASDFDLAAAAVAALVAAAGLDLTVEGNVGVGPGGIDPDAHPSGHRLRRGEVAFVDLYPRVDGYYGDCTRVFAAGRPAPDLAHAHECLWSALEEGAAALGPGVTCGEVDGRCRAALRREDLERFFPHHSGHGLGVSQQEPPWIVAGSGEELREGDVVTLEPGVYMPGRGGLRVEDTFVVTADGARRLTGAARELEPAHV